MESGCDVCSSVVSSAGEFPSHAVIGSSYKSLSVETGCHSNSNDDILSCKFFCIEMEKEFLCRNGSPAVGQDGFDEPGSSPLTRKAEAS